jgi:hypothetical protein
MSSRCFVFLLMMALVVQGCSSRKLVVGQRLPADSMFSNDCVEEGELLLVDGQWVKDGMWRVYGASRQNGSRLLLQERQYLRGVPFGLELNYHSNGGVHSLSSYYKGRGFGLAVIYNDEGAARSLSMFSPNSGDLFSTYMIPRDVRKAPVLMNISEDISAVQFWEGFMTKINSWKKED